MIFITNKQVRCTTSVCVTLEMQAMHASDTVYNSVQFQACVFVVVFSVSVESKQSFFFKKKHKLKNQTLHVSVHILHFRTNVKSSDVLKKKRSEHNYKHASEEKPTASDSSV